MFFCSIIIAQNANNMQDYLKQTKDSLLVLENHNNDFQLHDFENDKLEKKHPFFNPKKTNISLEMGTSFGSSGGGNMFSTFISPKISYDINPKLRITVGSVLSKTNINGAEIYNIWEGKARKINANVNSNLMYAEGQYMVNDRLIISGSIFYEKNDFGNMDNSGMHPSAFNFGDSKGGSIGFDYKINEKTSLSGEIQYSEGRNPYRNNSLRSSPFSIFNNQRNYNTGFGF